MGQMHDQTLSIFEAINSNEPKWGPHLGGLVGEMRSPSLRNNSLFDFHLDRFFPACADKSLSFWGNAKK